MRVTRACICGSDLWPYASMAPSESGQSMGHEAIGVVEAVGGEVRTRQTGRVVVMPFAISDGTCAFCHEGLNTACVHAGFFGNNGVNGAQAEALRIPYADGTLYPLGVGEDDALMPSLLTLSDVMGTGHHAAVVAGSSPGKIVAVVGDGAVGLCAVIAAKRLGAEQIIILGRHADRTALAREFGATDVVAERGEEAVERVRELTGGFGAHSVLECVGLEQSMETAIKIARPGGAVGRVGVPQDAAICPPPARVLRQHHDRRRTRRRSAPTSRSCCPTSWRAASSRAGCFDRTVDLDGVPDGYRAMADRESIKVMVRHDRLSALIATSLATPHSRLKSTSRHTEGTHHADHPQLIETNQGPATGSPATSTSTRRHARAARHALGAASVHFTPGARTAWHTHPLGQTIYVTEGIGRCQREGGPIEEIRPGDRVFFEPGENHWHGAAPRPLHDPHRDPGGRRAAAPSPGASTSPTSYLTPPPPSPSKSRPAQRPPTRPTTTTESTMPTAHPDPEDHPQRRHDDPAARLRDARRCSPTANRPSRTPS